jgi:tetratricopeptide (TPR) repeat protein
MVPLKTQAIQTALLGDWETAIQLNEELIKEDPKDIETLNRLAFAYSVVGKIKEARSTYQKVLDLDPLNSIAQRGLKKLIKSPATIQTPTIGKITNIFLEETGKTKVVELINTADAKQTSHLRTGESVILSIKRLKIFILDQQHQYIGMLPDNIGKRLIKFMNGGNTYEAYIKSVVHNKVCIFMREVKRATRFKNQPSFVATEKSHLLIEKNSHKNQQTKDSNEEEPKNYLLDEEEESD